MNFTGLVMQESYSPMWMSRSKRYEPQRKNNFQITIFGLMFGLGTIDLAVAADSVPMPKMGTEVIQIKHGNKVIKYAGTAKFEGLSQLTVIDYISADVEKTINMWRRQAYDERKDEVGYESDYKKDGILTEFSPDGTFQRHWNFSGLWPSEVDYGESLTHEGGVKKIHLTLQYDTIARR